MPKRSERSLKFAINLSGFKKQRKKKSSAVRKGLSVPSMASGFEDRGRDPPSENNSGQSGQEQRAPLGPEGSAGRPVLLDLDIVAGPRLRPLDVGCLEVLRPLLLLLLLSGHEGRGGVLRWLSLDCLHSVVRDRGFWGGFITLFLVVVVFLG